MKKNEKHIGIRIRDHALHYKLHFIAKYEGRTANAHILHLIRQDIRKFEKEHSEIELPKEE